MSARTASILALVLVGAYALTTRLLALAQPYHHDEYKWALAANPGYGMTDSIPHPFLARFLYQEFGGAFGYDYLRVLPLIGSIVLMMLLYKHVRRGYGRLAAVFALFIYGTSAYAILGSVQIDIDGVFLPLMALVTFMAYEAWNEAENPKKKRGYGLLMAACVLVGFLFKLSFILVPATLVFYYVFECMKGRDLPWKLIGGALVIGAVGLVGVLLLWKDVVFVRYVANFMALGGRDYMQVVFQSVKAALFLAPLGMLGFLLGLRQRRELALWYIFLAFNILFYFVVFDFTHRTFDRYLLFAVLPSSVITGVALAQLSRGMDLKRALVLSGILTVVLGAATTFLFSLPHRVIPLIPKSAFIDAALSGSWNFLIPITGGSGPMGLYLPVYALAVLWALAVIGALMLMRQRVRMFGVALLMSTFFVHSAFVTFEYLTGHYYGSVPDVTESLLAKLPADDRTVITYNDIAAYELYEQGRYEGRFYPHTKFVEKNLERLRTHDGYFLVVAFPELGAESPYTRFFSACTTLATARDRKIEGAMLNCSR